jgi:hypothetical protein
MVSRGTLIETLVASDVAKYIGFQLLNSVRVWDERDEGSTESGLAALRRVPGTKEDVFKDKSIPLLDKRRLMKALMFAGGEFESDELMQGKYEQLACPSRPTDPLPHRPRDRPDPRVPQHDLRPPPTPGFRRRIRRRARHIPRRARPTRPPARPQVSPQYWAIRPQPFPPCAVWRRGRGRTGLLPVSPEQ